MLCADVFDLVCEHKNRGGMTQNSDKPIIVWFRQDLRLRDNPALNAAHESGRPIIPVYILDDVNSNRWKMGGASRWWLHQSLKSLSADLGDALVFDAGDPAEILQDIVSKTGADTIFWNRCYEPWRIQRDKNIKSTFQGQGISAESYNGALLFEPHTALKGDGTPYRVFTPFFKRGCLGGETAPREPLDAPDNLNIYKYKRRDLDALCLMPNISWYKDMEDCWQPGEEGAQERLDQFLEHGLKGYKEGRNFPSRRNVSRLSPYLHFGEISPHEVWQRAQSAMVALHCETDGEHFMSELGWREFSNSLLYHFPEMPRKNMQSKFDAFEWRDDPKALYAWQKGMTGYPIIDAGIRELWQTGYMHNRVRMIVGSFLVKNLMIHWHHGEEWFWDTLVDADLANNSASWQWIAGCGADAAPYFRIFNPVTQSQKFDAKGEYIRRYVPEISKLSNKHIHAPWEAPEMILKASGVELGRDYPKPIVDLKSSRERALAAFKELSQS